MELLIIIKEILVACAVIIASVVAIKGLRLWRNQLKGTTEYQISKNLLEKVFALRDKLRMARFPLISAGEMSQREHKEGETPREQEINDLAYAYSKRLEVVDKAKSDLQIVKFETIALWGEESVETIDSFLEKVFTLYNSYGGYIDLRRIDREGKSDKLLREYESVIYGMGNENDEFWKEVNSAVLAIEDKFRLYLK